MSTTEFTPEFVESFPNPLESGVFYVSLEYLTCAHLCACGCGDEAVTPLSPAQWSFSYDGETISLRPSVGNWALACKSHYVVDRGHVRWVRTFSNDEIARNRARDRAALQFDDSKGASTPPAETHAAGTDNTVPDGGDRGSLGARVLRWLRRQ